MLHVFRVDLGETYTFETDLAFQNVKTLKSKIEDDHGISSSKQILIISGGELLDDDAVQVCMKTRATCAGTEENPIYLLDKSHLERSTPLQIPLVPSNIPILDNATVEQWRLMPSTYETIVQRTDTAQNFNKYAQTIVRNCERFFRDQQSQYQGWMAVIANIEDTLASFMLNRNSFNGLYQHYLSERPSYLELFESLPRVLKTLRRLKLPNKLTALNDNSSYITYKSTVSSSASSSSISSYATANATCSMQNEDEHQIGQEMTLYEWITVQVFVAFVLLSRNRMWIDVLLVELHFIGQTRGNSRQLANVKVDDIIDGCVHFIEECTEDLLPKWNADIDGLSRKISNPDLKHMVGIEERFALLQSELTNAKRLQHEQNDCADYLISQRQRFTLNVGNQRDLTLIRDISGIHSQNLIEISKRHQKLVDIEKKIRKSKQEIIDQLHRRFKNLMLLQRHLVDYDTKLSIYSHKLNRTKKTMTFLQQLNQTPVLYQAFLYECVRRRQYSDVFNQFSETIYHESKKIHNEEMTRREQFNKQYASHFLFNLLPALKTSPTFFIREPLPSLDFNLPDITLNEVDELFEQFPEIKLPNSEVPSLDQPRNLDLLIRCGDLFHRTECSVAVMPSSTLTPSTATLVSDDLAKRVPSSSNSSSRSTIVRSRSSSDVETPNELLPNVSLLPPDQLEQTIQQSDTHRRSEPDNSGHDEVPSEREFYSPGTSSAESQVKEESTSVSNSSNTANSNEEEDDYVKCSLDAVYSATEIATSPPHRSSVAQQTENTDFRLIRDEFLSLKYHYEQMNRSQHDQLLNYHKAILTLVDDLQRSNRECQSKIEQLQAEVDDRTRDNKALKIQCDLDAEIKQELTLKYASLEASFDEFRRAAEIEKCQTLQASQPCSDHAAKTCPHRQDEETAFRSTSNTQTDESVTCDKQTSMGPTSEHKLIQTDPREFNHQSVQTSFDESSEMSRRLITKDQQMQFNLAIQRAVVNATDAQKKQIDVLEQQLEDKRVKIVKLKECIKKLQNFYALSTTPPPILPVIARSVMTTSNDDEQRRAQDEKMNLMDESGSRTAFLKRSEPISMPSTFVVQSVLAAENTGSSPKTEPSSITPAASNLLMDTCFKSSPNESSAVELYTPFAASPPNPITNLFSPHMPAPMSPVVSSSPGVPVAARASVPSANPSHQAMPISFFTVNRSDRVVIYFDPTYQHFMILTYLPTLHFIHSDCYDSFNIQSKPSSLQQGLTANVTESTLNESGKSSIGNPMLINTSMINSTVGGSNAFVSSAAPLLGQVTDKEYCQAKKANNRFNVPLGTKFYRVRVKPWKPTQVAAPH